MRKSRQKPSKAVKSRQKPSDGFWRKATAFDDCTPGGRFFQFLIWPIMTNFVVKNFVIYINITNMDREDPESRIRYLASLSWLSGYVASSSTTCRVKKWYDMKYDSEIGGPFPPIIHPQKQWKRRVKNNVHQTKSWTCQPAKSYNLLPQEPIQ